MNAFPDWLNTEHETIDEVVASDRSAVFKITARWQTGNNAPHKLVTLTWIAVKTNGKWGIQFRHNLGTI